ncbi:hypothetical protein [Nostoc sp.]|uniref:hypothetical protein n=1 Tax=Nostoc sp. TaxID=1180 RepID=UPI002FFC640A
MSKYDWSKFQKLIRRIHNLYVNTQIRKETKKTKKSLLEYAFIDPKDTAQLIIAKQLYYWIFFGANKTDAIAVVPEWWPIRKGADCPQLVILFKSKKNTRAYYTLQIPHYDDIKDFLKFDPFRLAKILIQAKRP